MTTGSIFRANSQGRGRSRLKYATGSHEHLVQLFFQGLESGKMHCVFRIVFFMLLGQASFLVDNILSGQLLNEVERLECNISCTDRLNLSNSWEPYLKVRFEIFIN